MSSFPPALIVPFLVLWASLTRALLVAAKVAPRACARCGLRFERQNLGDPICRCGGNS
jgi:hypothetical protein